MQNIMTDAKNFVSKAIHQKNVKKPSHHRFTITVLKQLYELKSCIALDWPTATEVIYQMGDIAGISVKVM